MEKLKPIEFAFSLDYISTISEGDKDFMIELMDMFLEQTPPQINLILTAIQQTDFETIANTAHKIKPSFGMFGFNDARHFFASIETEAKQKIDINALEKQINTFLPLLNLLYTKIEESKSALLVN